jgi:hypothetical protein
MGAEELTFLPSRDTEFDGGDGGGDQDLGALSINQVHNGYIVNQIDENGEMIFVFTSNQELVDYLRSYYLGS